MNYYTELKEDIVSVFSDLITKYDMTLNHIDGTNFKLIGNRFNLDFYMEREGLEVDIKIGNGNFERLLIWCMNKHRISSFESIITYDSETEEYGHFKGLRLETVGRLMFYKKMFKKFVADYIS